MTTVQIIWMSCIAVILLLLVVMAVMVYHLHPLHYMRRHHFFGIEHYDFLYDDDDCDE